MTDLIEELQWRGLIAQHTNLDSLREALEAGPISFYCGFDPTGPSLHHGHLVQVILMRHLQNAGHHALALVGGATGLIGDPRDSGERNMQAVDIVEDWASRLRGQLERYLNFQGENPAQIVNNLDWTRDLSAIGLLRDIGKYFRLGTMLSKDTVARRLNSSEGISFTEFSYQILQAYDFLSLYRSHGAILETGGNDQWGNLVGGMDLIHKVEGKSVHVMTTPIITKSDGTKFGKSEGGAIWLDPAMMSPYAFYQFWMQTADEDVVRFLKIFTFLPQEEIEAIGQEIVAAPHLRAGQRALAVGVTRFVHGKGPLQEVLAATEALWGGGDLRSVGEATLREAVSLLPSGTIEIGASTVVDALVASGLENGRAAARRTISANGLAVNNSKVTDEEMILAAGDLLPGDFILLRKGRRNLAVVYPK